MTTPRQIWCAIRHLGHEAGYFSEYEPGGREVWRCKHGCGKIVREETTSNVTAAKQQAQRRARGL